MSFRSVPQELLTGSITFSRVFCELVTGTGTEEGKVENREPRERAKSRRKSHRYRRTIFLPMHRENMAPLSFLKGDNPLPGTTKKQEEQKCRNLRAATSCSKAPPAPPAWAWC